MGRGAVRVTAKQAGGLRIFGDMDSATDFQAGYSNGYALVVNMGDYVYWLIIGIIRTSATW